jgi:hypothetical protein
MATTYATEIAGQSTTPVTKSNGGVMGGRVRRFRASITLASQASGDDIVLAKVPAGANFAHGVINSDTSLGTATVSVGITGTTAKYKAAGTFTATDTPTLFGKAGSANDDNELTAEETVLLTIGTAALPASGNLVVDLYYSAP